MIQRKAKEPTLLTMITTSLSFSLASTGFCKIGWYCEKIEYYKTVYIKSRIQSRKSRNTVVNHSSLHLTSPLACLGDLGGGTSWDLGP